MDLEQNPKPWYKSRTVISNILTTALGIAVATGAISPEHGTALGGNIEPIVGGIVAVLGLVSIWSRSDVTKVSAGKGEGPPTVSVPVSSPVGEAVLEAAKQDVSIQEVLPIIVPKPQPQPQPDLKP